MQLTQEELKKLAEPLCGEGHLSRINARDGELAVTDGRLLLHVWSPEIAGIPGSFDNVLDFAPIGSPEVVVGPEWVSGPLAEAVRPAWEKARKDQERRQKEIENEAVPDPFSVKRCPCCGARLVYDGGDLVELDDYVETERARKASWRGVAILALPVGSDPFFVSLHYLWTALSVATRLGGATALEICLRTNTATLRGEGFFVVFKGLVPDWASLDELDIRIDIPADVIAKEGGANE